VEVEDALRNALVGVGRRVEEDQRDRNGEQGRRHAGQHGQVVALQGLGHGSIVDWDAGNGWM
jgi:hypothetical protein